MLRKIFLKKTKKDTEDFGNLELKYILDQYNLNPSFVKGGNYNPMLNGLPRS